MCNFVALDEDPADELDEEDAECLRQDPDFDFDDVDDRLEDSDEDPEDGEALNEYEVRAIVDEDKTEEAVRG